MARSTSTASVSASCFSSSIQIGCFAASAARTSARSEVTRRVSRSRMRACMAESYLDYARAMSDLATQFAEAQARIKPVTGLGSDTMLELYALFKQATAGDASGDRPGMLDLKGRAKY